MGTEQEQNGLNEQQELTPEQEKALFDEVYGAARANLGDKSAIVTPEEPTDPPAVTPTAEAEKTEETPTEEAKPETPEAPTDPLAGLPDNIRKMIEDKEKELEAARKAELEWKQKYKSDEGRVAAFQRQAEEAKRLLNQRQAPQPVHAPTKSKIEESEEWKALSETDPALARLMKSFAEDATRQAEARAEEKIRAATEPLYQERQQASESRERELVYKLVPNLDEVLADEVYQDWFANQPEGIRNLGTSAQGTHRIMQLYAYDMQAKFGAPAAPKKEEAKPEAPVVDPAKVAAIQEQRDKKLQTQGVGAKVTPPVQELDEKALFEREFKKNLRKPL